MSRYLNVKPESPLVVQFRQQKEHRGLSIQKIAELTDLAIPTVERALSETTRRRMTLDTASLIGHVLGFAQEHVVCCWMRERARDRGAELKRDHSQDAKVVMADVFEQIHDGLRRWTKRQRQIFQSKGSGRRLAVRQLRICGLEEEPREQQISRRALAEHIAKAKKSDALKVRRRADLGRRINAVHRAIRYYEGDLLGLDSNGLGAILDAVSGELGQRVEPSDLKTIVERLKTAHSVRKTCHWKAYHGPARRDGAAEASRARAMKLLPPAYVVMDEEWSRLESGRSKTCLGPIEVEFITMEQQLPEARGTLRIINARHPGLEIAVVLEGRARFTLSTRKLPNEVLEERVLFEEGVGGVVHDAIYREGDVVIFDSSRYHRVECYAPRCRFVSILLSGNVALGRALDRRST